MLDRSNGTKKYAEITRILLPWEPLALLSRIKLWAEGSGCSECIATEQED